MRNEIANSIASALQEFSPNFGVQKMFGGEDYNWDIIGSITEKVMRTIQKPIGMVISLDDDEVTTVTCDSEIPIKLFVEDSGRPESIGGQWVAKQAVLVDKEMVSEYIESTVFVNIKTLLMDVTDWVTMQQDGKANGDLLLSNLSFKFENNNCLQIIHQYSDNSKELICIDPTLPNALEMLHPPFNRRIKSITSSCIPANKEGTVVDVEVYIPEAYCYKNMSYPLTKGSYVKFFSGEVPEIN